MECGDPLHPERGVNMADLYTLYTASNTFTNITFDVLMDQGYVKWRCPWTVVDALYFAMATMTSVGYGDLTANKDAFGIMLALIGVLLFMGLAKVAFEIVQQSGGGAIAGCMRTPPAQRLRAYVEERWSPSDDLKLGTVAFGLCIAFFAMHIFFANIFTLLEDWRFSEAFYHCVITALTVGYGDVSIETQAGRVWAFFHMILSVVFFAEVVAVRARSTSLAAPPRAAGTTCSWYTHRRAMQLVHA
jgi:hypothetical protein